MLLFVKKHFKFVFTIVWMTFLCLLICHEISVFKKNMDKTNEIHFNYINFKIDTLGEDFGFLEKGEAFSRTLRYQKEVIDKM